MVLFSVASRQTHLFQLDGGVTRTVHTLPQLCTRKSTLHRVTVQILHRQRELMRAVHTGPDPFTQGDKKRKKHLIENRPNIDLNKLLWIIFILVVVALVILDFKTE